MMEVLVVRHAIALTRDEAKTQGILDRDRPLTKQGRSRMQQAARGLRTRVPEVSALITSPLRRARETAEILHRRYKHVPQTESDALLPDADPAQLCRVLGDSGLSCPVVIGHEPHLSGWVSWCLTGDSRSVLELRKGGACLLRFAEAPGQAQGQLLWLFTPAALRRLW
jgi:phosphohistidine phosphatase